MPLRELKILEASRNGTIFENAPPLRWPVCQAQMRRFHLNIQMVLALGGSAPWAALMAVEWEKSGEAAKKIALPSEQKEKRMKIMEILTNIDKNERDGLLMQHAQNLDQFVTRCGPFIHDMFEDILRAMCVQSWTALEVLIADLHGECIDNHKSLFSQEVLTKREKTKNVEPGKFGFTTRDVFCKSYWAAFNCPVIDATLKEDAVNILCVLRNLIVHNGGVVDQFFLSKDFITAPGIANFFTIQKDKELLLDGDIVRAIIDSAFKSGHSILKAVDAWITANSPHSS